MRAKSSIVDANDYGPTNTTENAKFGIIFRVSSPGAYNGWYGMRQGDQVLWFRDEGGFVSWDRVTDRVVKDLKIDICNPSVIVTIHN